MVAIYRKHFNSCVMEICSLEDRCSCYDSNSLNGTKYVISL